MDNLGGLMKQAQDMQKRIEAMRAEINLLEVEGCSGGGLVRVIMAGDGAIKRLVIDPSLLKPEEAEIVEDLIVAAHSDGRTKLDKRVQEKMQAITGGLTLPPGFNMGF